MIDAREEFRAAIMAAGLTAPDEIIDDGELHRFAPNGNPRDKSAFYWFHNDERPIGGFGCWKHQIKERWSAGRREFTAEEKAAWRAKMEQAEAERAEAERISRESAAAKAAEMWARATETDHEYLTRKQVANFGLRVLDGELLVPMRHGRGAYVGLQRITADGGKFFLNGTPAGGAYHVIGKPDPNGTVVIAEGYATGASVHMATSLCVVLAFSSGNLTPVAQKIRAAMPAADIVIAADDDRWTEGNPGVTAAKAAARSVGGSVVSPHWRSHRAIKRTDFNDLHCDEGLDAVAACFETPSLGSGRDHAESVSSAQAENNHASTETDARLPSVDSAVDAPPRHVSPAPTGGGAASDVLPPAEERLSMAGAQAIIAYDLDTNADGIAYATITNMVRILGGDDAFRGKIWYDEFLERIMTTWRSPDGSVREWREVDDLNLQICLQAALMMPRLSKQTVADAVTAAAHQDKRNECRAYLECLEWDGIERLPHFMQDCFGTDDSEYVRRAGENFWVSMVARVLQPGCKVDTMIVLEGMQGKGKSEALAIIGGPWFTEAHQSPTDKDFYLNLTGKMIVEIGEMDAFNRAEVTKVKQVITCRTDRYRAPYERRSADHPRRCVFAGTTNRDDWNKDETGARRFWPVYVQDVRHDILRENRDQYFAEAVAKLSHGATWWHMPLEETLAQQEGRRDADAIEEMIVEWLIGRNEVTVRAVMEEMMKLPIDRQDKSMQIRIGKALRAIGWRKPTDPVWRGGRLVRIWKRPGAPVQADLSEQPV